MDRNANTAAIIQVAVLGKKAGPRPKNPNRHTGTAAATSKTNPTKAVATGPGEKSKTPLSVGIAFARPAFPPKAQKKWSPARKRKTATRITAGIRNMVKLGGGA